MPDALVYIATKGAIEQLSRALAKDFGVRGITVNTVSPGPTDTELFRKGKTESFINYIASQTPSNKLGQPEDIASVISFLASPAAGWINGQNIVANGVSTTILRIWLLELTHFRASLCKRSMPNFVLIGLSEQEVLRVIVGFIPKEVKTT